MNRGWLPGWNERRDGGGGEDDRDDQAIQARSNDVAVEEGRRTVMVDVDRCTDVAI